MYFAHPEALLLIIPIVWVLWLRRMERKQVLLYPSLNPVLEHLTPVSRFKQYLPGVLKFLSALFFVVAISDPQYQVKETLKMRERREITIVLDLSESMSWSLRGEYKAENVEESREAIAKKAVQRFIESREESALLESQKSDVQKAYLLDLQTFGFESGEIDKDRIGLVVFSSDAYVKFPPTTDYKILKEHLSEVSSRLPALGTNTELEKALFTAIILTMRPYLGAQEISDMESNLKSGSNRLYIPGSLAKKKFLGKGKVIILFTDGEVELPDKKSAGAILVDDGPVKKYSYIAPKIDLLKAVKLAEELGVKVYMLSTGKIAESLKKALLATGGRTFTLQNADSYWRVIDMYEEINRLEKAKLIDKEYTRNASSFFWFGLAGLISLTLGEIARSLKWFRVIP
jgi:hypothetical protein